MRTFLLTDYRVVIIRFDIWHGDCDVAIEDIKAASEGY